MSWAIWDIYLESVDKTTQDSIFSWKNAAILVQLPQFFNITLESTRFKDTSILMKSKFDSNLFSDSRQSSKQQTGMNIMFAWWHCTVASFVCCQKFWKWMFELNKKPFLIRAKLSITEDQWLMTYRIKCPFHFRSVSKIIKKHC